MHSGDADPRWCNEYHFTFTSDSAFGKWGEIFTGDYILWHPLHSGTIFDSQATTLTPILNLLKPKSTGFDIGLRTTSTTMSSFMSFRKGVFPLSCKHSYKRPTHIHTTHTSWQRDRNNRAAVHRIIFAPEVFCSANRCQILCQIFRIFF